MPFLVRLGSNLLEFGDILLDLAPSTQINEDRTSSLLAVAHHQTWLYWLFAPLTSADLTRGGRQSVVGVFLFHSIWEGQVRVAAETNPDWPMDSPSYDDLRYKIPLTHTQS